MPSINQDSTAKEMLEVSVNGLMNACNALIQIAAKDGYLNPHTPELNDIFICIKESFERCINVKTLLAELKRIESGDKK